MCFKITKGEILSQCRFFGCQTVLQIRGHMYKLYKQQASAIAYKFVFSNWVCEIWSALHSNVVESSSSAMFKRLLDNVKLSNIESLC